MKRTASVRNLNSSTPGSMEIGLFGTEGESSDKSQNPGNVQLLTNVTLDDIAASNLPWKVRDGLESFLQRGEVPSNYEDVSLLAHWMVGHQQDALLNRLLGLAPARVEITDQRTADGLLAIMRSGLSFSGLTILLDTTSTNDEVMDKVLPLIAQAFQVNASLASIQIVGGRYCHFAWANLFAVLEGVKALELVTYQGILRAPECNLLANLLSKNRTIRELELCNLITADPYDEYYFNSVTNLFKQVGGQLQLERLELNCVPQHCAALLGGFLSASQTLTELLLELSNSPITEPLGAGLRDSVSIKRVDVDVPSVEDSMLPLIAGIAENKGSIKELVLTSRQGRSDGDDSGWICDLLARNNSLASLEWRLSTDSNLSFFRLAAALGSNRRLESIFLLHQGDPIQDKGPMHRMAWLGEEAVQRLAESVRKNRNLKTLYIDNPADVDRSNIVPYKWGLNHALEENRAWQLVACSDEFIEGAAQGLFASLDMPRDAGKVMAQFLMETPRTLGSRAIALVNKATYESAVGSRRQAHEENLAQWLPMSGDGEDVKHESMVRLLQRIIATKKDFSIENLLKIGAHPCLVNALLEIMDRNAAGYLLLIKLFSKVIDIEVLRLHVLDEISSISSPYKINFTLLEQSFPPDQGHLARFVENPVDTRSIDLPDVRLYVGYGIWRGSMIYRDIEKWCIRNVQPGVLMAFVERYNPKSTGYSMLSDRIYIDADCPGPYREGMMEKLPLLQQTSIGHLEKPLCVWHDVGTSNLT